MIAEVCAILINIAPVLSNEVAYIRVPAGTVLVETDGILPTGWIYWSPGLDQAPVRMNMPPWLYTGAVTATTVQADSLRSDVLWLGTGGGYVSNSPPGAIEIGGRTKLRLADMQLDVSYEDTSLLLTDNFALEAVDASVLADSITLTSAINGIDLDASEGGLDIWGAITFHDMSILEASAIGVTVQAYDADLADLADGSLSGSKVGTGIAAGNITSGTIPTTVLPWAGTYSGSTATRGTAWVNDRLTFGGLVLDSGQLTPGTGAYGVGLEFSTISTDGSLRKKASIVPRQYGADVDQLGLDVFASGSTGAGDLMQLAIRIQGSSVYFPGSVAFSNGLTVAGGAISGSGSGITGLNGSQITSGTISTGVLPMAYIGGGSGTVDDDVLVNGTGVDTAADFRDSSTIEWSLSGAAPGTVTASVVAGSIGSAEAASALTLDAEWDTAAEINAATTDEDFVTESDLADLTVTSLTGTDIQSEVFLLGTGGGYITNASPGAIEIGGKNTLRVIADIIPQTDATDDIGSAAYGWRNVYASTGVFAIVNAETLAGPTNYTADADTGMTIAGDLTLTIQGDIIADAAILPDANNTIDIGASGTRWRTIYSATGNFTDVQAVGVTADEFVGGGSGLTDLDGDEITSGTVADARIASTIARDSELPPKVLAIAVSDETSDLTTGTAKATFRMPCAMSLDAVRASLTTAPVGSTVTVDINESGSTILSTKITIDATEKTSTTAATAPVISDASLADDAEITIDIDAVGASTAGAGLKIYLIDNP